MQHTKWSIDFTINILHFLVNVMACSQRISFSIHPQVNIQPNSNGVWYIHSPDWGWSGLLSFNPYRHYGRGRCARPHIRFYLFPLHFSHFSFWFPQVIFQQYWPMSPCIKWHRDGSALETKSVCGQTIACVIRLLSGKRCRKYERVKVFNQISKITLA